MSNEEEYKGQFLELYEQYADDLFRYCFFKTGSRERSIDMVQDVFTRVWQKLQLGDLLDNPKAFLYASVRNSVTDWYRKKKTVSLDELSETGFDIISEQDTGPSNRLEAERILDKANELEEKYKEVIILRFVNDLSVTEIAAIVGETENNISVRLHRAIGKLKELYIKDDKEQ